MHNRKTVGIVGNWSSMNYGAQLTYYALYRTMVDEGYNVVMIEGCKDVPQGDNVSGPKLFRNNPYEVGSLMKIHNVQADILNESIDTFVVGSDQLWRYIFFKKSIDTNLLAFANSHKRKISYATSFGEKEFIAPSEHLAKMKFFLGRFHKISVREQSGVDICKNEFEVDAECVLDPVFLCDKKYYEQLIEKSNVALAEPFVFAYVLHPSPRKKDVIKEIARKFGKKVIWVRNLHKTNYDDWNVPFEKDCKLEEWLYYIKNADCIITDSFHACCLSVIFNKQIVPVFETTNGLDSVERMVSLANMLGMEAPDTLDCLEDKSHDGVKNIDYTVLNRKLEIEKNRSKKWLSDAVNTEVTYDKTDLLWDVIRPQFRKIYYLEQTVLEQKRELNKMKYANRNLVLFGAGKVLEKNIQDITKNLKICAIVDNDVEKWGVEYGSYVCTSPEKILEIDKPVVMVTVANIKVYRSIREQLAEMGIKDIIPISEWIELQ